MAILKGPLAFKGKLQGFSAYIRTGTEGVILRQSSGPSKKDIATKPCYANTRKNNKEFGGRSTASKYIRDGYFALKSISDTSNLSRLNSLLKHIQEMDTINEYGKRSVALSLRRELLEGFALNQYHHFDAIIQNPIEAIIIREQLSATLTIPALLPQVNFAAPTLYPYFRIVTTLSVVPDLYCHEPKYRPKQSYGTMHPNVVKTQWMAVDAGCEPIHMELKIDNMPPDDAFSLVLTIGIEQGTAKSNTLIQGVKYAGAGKILKVG